MNIISIISAFATVILLICFIVFTNLKGFKKGLIFLITSIVTMLICIFCQSSDVRVWLQSIFAMSSFLFAFGCLGLFSKETRKIGLTSLTSLLICIIVMSTTGMSWRSKSSKKYYDKYGNSYYSEEKRDNANFLYDAYDAADEYR